MRVKREARGLLAMIESLSEWRPKAAGRNATAELLTVLRFCSAPTFATFLFGIGDSENPVNHVGGCKSLIQKVDNMIGLTIMMNVPAGNYWCSEADDVVHYIRTIDYNEESELGINDMKLQEQTSDANTRR